ncbi:NIPSNAP family protein [Umezawaea endophytica]|uniref:NIPSNAP family protein n=1 Tax=Umezawaea endophytica TaxID=1654476 RepID=A0A9X2VKQ3_9PSEU|nr:NIPSNAP family protein [Umezawaea endophytica]MCS7477894.1 NIPSNAP family protein [Umezawaea endophytica]
MHYEIRREQARPGCSDDLAACMDDLVIPLHQEKGMTVVGTFVDADGGFVWLRRFADDAEREAVVDAVHRDPRWTREVGPAIRALLLDGGSTTTTLRPTDRSGLR